MFALEPLELDLLATSVPNRILSEDFYAATVLATQQRKDKSGWMQICQVAGVPPRRVLEYWHESHARWGKAEFSAHFQTFDQGWQDVAEALEDFLNLEDWLDSHEPMQWHPWFAGDGPVVGQYAASGGLANDLERIIHTLRTLDKKGETRFRFLKED